tara:strand:+ start:373 stop:609 length:237 start_codon:yes stop_codon:yes gene_type:complete
MNRLRIESPNENKVTFSQSVNRISIEYTDPIKVSRTETKNEINLDKQGTDTVLVAIKSNTKELIVKQVSNTIRTIQTD